MITRRTGVLGAESRMQVVEAGKKCGFNALLEDMS